MKNTGLNAKRFKLAALITGGLAAATIGLAGPAAAAPGIDIPIRHSEYSWHGDIGSDIRHDIRHDIRQNIRHDIRDIRDIRHDVRHDIRHDIRRAVDGGR